MLEEFVVHVPELVLQTSSVSSDCGTQRVWVSSHCREVPKDKSEIRGKTRTRLFEDRKELSTMNALKVSILKKRYRRGRRSGDMVRLRYQVLEFYYCVVVRRHDRYFLEV